ncbi:NAD(P)-binding protein [Epithele typhae]|uniref:NAD(P)-binding protein n=1 Tax=Epithele typhae TaxID=378194 RepID=UPI002007D9D7|nr:NAD(P)-binding protein [Epithele typhae]KAH9924653.1 NAD(P)-binding protein [Epithele typhae]
MSSYVVVGASRGLGVRFVLPQAKDKNNTVFGVVRNPATATKLAELATSLPNVHAIQGDLDNAQTLQTAAEDVAKVTGGTLDVLINNGAAIITPYSMLTLDNPDPKALEDDLVGGFRTNTIGTIHAINAFLPLLRKGAMKKIVCVTSGAGSIELALKINYDASCMYSISKAASNMAAAQFAVALRPEGFTVLSISPGYVNTMTEDPSAHPPAPSSVRFVKQMTQAWQKHYPSWDGLPKTPAVAVSMILDVMNKNGPENSGAFLSHHNNQEWF